MSKFTIHLTNEQQRQIKDGTGKDVTELCLDFSSSGQLSTEELDRVQGGGGVEILSWSWGASQSHI